MAPPFHAREFHLRIQLGALVHTLWKKGVLHVGFRHHNREIQEKIRSLESRVEELERKQSTKT